MKILPLIFALLHSVCSMAQQQSHDKIEKPYQTGKATYYGNKAHGRRQADGTKHDKNALTCAHRTLAFGTKLRVVNKKNGKEVVVKVTDRGPFSKGRIVDLSTAAARQLGMLADGVVEVDIYLTASQSSDKTHSSTADSLQKHQ